MKEFKLFMILLGAKPEGRHIEQHDVFFTIAEQLRDCVDEIKAYWPAGRSLHIDGWRNVLFVDGYSVKIEQRVSNNDSHLHSRLFFVNLGGYKPGEFEEFHYKLITAAPDRETAILQAKQSAFLRHYTSGHIDDKYGIDVDDIYSIEDILPHAVKQKFSIQLSPTDQKDQDEVRLGYFRLDKI